MSELVGIIHPPPDLKGIVDSTAKYVAKNGGAFEERIMREHKDKPKFSFLFSNDPFNAYYRHKVQEIRNSLLADLDNKATTQDTSLHDSNQVPTKATNDDDDHEPRSEASAPSQSNEHHTNNNNDTDADRRSSVGHQDDNDEQCSSLPKVNPKLDEYIQERHIQESKPLEEPPRLNFLASPSAVSTRFECDIVKLTSQFISTYGRSFLLELVSREHSNSKFDFLKPQHGQFSYLTQLIIQYSIIRNCPLDICEQLKRDSTDQKHLLEQFRMRARWNRMLEDEKKKRAEAEEREKLLYSQIDWHDFVIVETIEYGPDEKGEYPPTTADQVGTRVLLQERIEDHNKPEEMDMDMDVESASEDEPEPEPEFIPPQVPDASRLVIRKDYDPKAISVAKSAPNPDNYFVSPITNELIPVDKIHEHVRYNLADPRYLEKKDQMLRDKINDEAVFASGSQIQDSLKNLAERRTDIFGMNDEETAIGQRIGEEEPQQPKDNRLIWDGHKSSLKKKRLN